MSNPRQVSVSADQMERAFREFRDIVGSDWASTTEEDKNAYHDPYNPGDPMERSSGGFVAPKEVKQVQEIVKVAGKHGIPLWTMSTGKNLAYGGSAPRVSGTVVLDLKRMNRIFEVDDKLAYAVVEPGVSFFDLHGYLKANNHNLWMSVPGPGWGSVLGNGVERGVGYGFYSDHYDSSCGLEVVLPDGELLRTGMGAMTGNKSFHLFNHGYGPTVDAMFTQSNYGIVTRMGRNLFPQPESFLSCEVNCRNDSDLEVLVEALRPFKVDQTIRNSLVITNLEILASFMSVRSQWYDGDDPIPEEMLIAMQDKLKLGRWNASFALFGSKAVTEDGWRRVQNAVKHIPGVELYAREYSPEDPIMHPRDQAMAGIPSLGEFSLVNWRGAGGHIDFSPVGPFTGKDARIMNETVRKLNHDFGFDHMGGFFCDTRSFRCINPLVFRKDDPEEMARVREMFTHLIAKFAKMGYGEYRTHLAYMDQVAGTYDFNNNAMLKFHTRLKNAIDPQGILAPGKSGIWPSA